MPSSSALGRPEQVREELQAEERTTTRRVLDVWGENYRSNGMPTGLMRRVGAHLQECPLRPCPMGK